MRSSLGLTCLAVVFVVGGAWQVGCATGGDPQVDTDPDPGSSRLDAGRLPDPVRPDGAAPGPSGDGGGTPDAGDACAEALAAIAFDFESGDQGWTHGASDGITGSDPSWPYDGWSRTAATNGTTCHAGSCFGAELTQNYAQCQRGYLLSPAIDLSKCAGRDVALVYFQAYAFWSGSYGGQSWSDGAVVEVSADGQSWQVPTAPGVYSGTVAINPSQTTSYRCVQKPFGVDGKPGFVGKSATTAKVTIPLPAAVVGKTTQIRFSMASGVSSQTTDPSASRAATDFGWRIDDVGFVLR